MAPRPAPRPVPGSASPAGLTALDRPAEKRSVALSYLFWCTCFVGVCGLQRFYNRKPASGVLWLLTFGLCGIGQLLDLILVPDMVRQANQALLLEETLAGTAAVAYPPIERQLLQLARRTGPTGFTLNDALLEMELPPEANSAVVTAEIERLLLDHLLDVGNDERGRVVYREP
ncbi:TM2 domain-containing protein [Synechococcus sp. CCY 9618]|uniref:TM2 domain-containing protein n=1 Tax=Synechococcus sp. CCY 9618 TaxID=2815602 RepID=UPI001C23CDC9|nr:TM2 domain-containing protein [Synechococcus sp. CCY 9618]